MNRKLIIILLLVFPFIINPLESVHPQDALLAKIQGGDFYHFESMLQPFNDLANSKTGMTMSFLNGQSSITRTGANTYDMALWAMGTAYGRRVITTYAHNSIAAMGQDQPQTLSRGLKPQDGVLSFIRMTDFQQVRWWDTWEWSVKAGENSWIGLAAIRDFVQFQDPFALNFAKQRGEFLLSLQDTDGALRMGPKGQYFPYLKNGWWDIKSTENNESALYFFDALYLVTQEEVYKKAADRIYNWLMTKMINIPAGLFHRGMVYKSGGFLGSKKWKLDQVNWHSPDTLTWAPLERMVNDPRLGKTKLQRLQVLNRMSVEVERRTGVFLDGRLVGISFSQETKQANIVSPEWTAQYVLFCRWMAETYQKQGGSEDAARFSSKADLLLESLKAFYDQNGHVLPYGLYATTGRPAKSIDTRHGWNTPDSDAALSSSIYYSFSLNGFDPLRDLIPKSN